MKFGIDLGHGVGKDRGAVGVIAEENIINTIGILVISKLKSLGHTVVDLRPTNTITVNDSLYARYHKADINNVDICVSIHANCGGGYGTEIFTYGGKDVAGASKILNNICSLGFRNRGLKDGKNLAMVRRPQATAMLIEICFCDSENDVKLYNNNIENIANAIVNGLTGENISSTKYKKGWNLDDTGWWYSTDGETYYKDCWKEIDNKYYSFDSQGYARHDCWIKNNGKWYYLDEHCEMVQAVLPQYVIWKEINNNWYCFGTDGALYVDCVTYDGYTVDKNGAWIESIPKK